MATLWILHLVQNPRVRASHGGNGSVLRTEFRRGGGDAGLVCFGRLDVFDRGLAPGLLSGSEALFGAASPIGCRLSRKNGEIARGAARPFPRVSLCAASAAERSCCAARTAPPPARFGRRPTRSREFRRAQIRQGRSADAHVRGPRTPSSANRPIGKKAPTIATEWMVTKEQTTFFGWPVFVVDGLVAPRSFQFTHNGKGNSDSSIHCLQDETTPAKSLSVCHT